MPDHFCIVSDHENLKFSSHRHNVSPAADSYMYNLCPVLMYNINVRCVTHTHVDPGGEGLWPLSGLVGAGGADVRDDGGAASL